jgi:O-antigen/teichoic acid export membrane protein
MSSSPELPDQPSIGRSIARGAVWTVGIRIVERVIGVVSTLILARLLLPEDYGLVAMGTVILGLLEAMQAFGFEWAVIQRGTQERRLLDTAWTLNVIIGGITALLLLAVAPLAAQFYDEPRVVTVLLVLAVITFVSRARNVGTVLFEQEMNFRPVFLMALVRRLVAFAVTLGIAFHYRNYTALLAGMVVGAVVDLALSYWMHPYRPKFSLAATKELFSFSIWLMINNLLYFLSNRGAEFVIGGRSGAAALGTYNVAYELSNLPTTELVHPVMRAAFPGYAKLSQDKARIAAMFLDIFGMTALIAVPAGVGLACVAGPFVDVALGHNWSGAVALVPPLALFGTMRALQGTTGSVYMALGRTKYLTVLAAAYVLLGVGLFALTLIWQPLSVAAWVLFLATSVVAAWNLWLLSGELPLRPLQVIARLARPAVASALMAAALLGLQWQWEGLSRLGSPAQLLLLVPLGAVIYTVVLWQAWRFAGGDVASPEARTFTLARRWLGRNR